MWLFSPLNRKSLVGEATFLAMPGSELGPIIEGVSLNREIQAVEVTDVDIFSPLKGFMLSYTLTGEQKGPRLRPQCDFPILPEGSGPSVVVVGF